MKQYTCPCGLEKGCKNPYLHYDGPSDPIILVIGEAPGRDEDEKKHLFVGRSGKLLRNTLVELGVDLEQVGFTNTCSCRPPDNRTPTATEIKCCSSRLVQTIADVAHSVKLVLLMGNVPLKAVLGKSGITKYHGITSDVGGVPYVPIFHPSYVERNRDDNSILDMFVADLEKSLSLLQERRETYSYRDISGKELIELIPELQKAPYVAIDCETANDNPATYSVTNRKDALDPYDHHTYIIGIGLSWRENEGVFVTLEHDSLVLTRDEWEERHTALQLILSDSTIKKVTQNGAFDTQIIASILGIHVASNNDDTMLAHHLVDENSEHKLQRLTNKYLSDMAGYDDWMNGFMEEHNYHMEEAPLEKIIYYCCGDVVATWRLNGLLREEMRQQNLLPLYQNIVIPASQEYAQMQYRGVKIDLNEKVRLQRDYAQRVTELESMILSLPVCKRWEERVGSLPNLNSHVQMKQLYYDKDYCALPAQYNVNDKGEKVLTTDADARLALLALPEKEIYREGRELVELVDTYSKVKKLSTTFVNSVDSWLKDDGLVHPQFRLTGTVTGRLSCSAPNVQNIPKEIPNNLWLRDHPIKRMFISKFSDGVLINADYSQLELRLMACFSLDEKMVETYRTSGDLHATSGRLLHPDYDTVSEEVRKMYRNEGKTYNFSSAYSLSEEFITTYPGLRKFVDEARKEILDKGYATTIFGRRRRLPEVRAYDRKEREHAFRQGINFKIQSSGHELLKRATIRVSRRLSSEGCAAHLILDVHDALVVDAPHSEIPIVKDILISSMENMEELSWAIIPFKIEVSVGKNWQDQETIYK